MKRIYQTQTNAAKKQSVNKHEKEKNTLLEQNFKKNM